MKSLEDITTLNQLYLLIDKSKYKISDVKKNKASHSFRIELTHITEIKISIYCCFYLVLDTYRFQLYLEYGNKNTIATYATSLYADMKNGDFRNNNFTEFKTKVPDIIESIIEKDLTSLQAICNYYGLGEGLVNSLSNPSFGIIGHRFDLYFGVYNLLLKDKDRANILINNALEYYIEKIKTCEEIDNSILETNPDEDMTEHLEITNMFKDYKILTESIISRLKSNEFDSIKFLDEIEAIE